MTQQPRDPKAEQIDDPDGDPDMLNPRDVREDDEYAGDPDADPGNLNPRSGSQAGTADTA